MPPPPLNVKGDLAKVMLKLKILRILDISEVDNRIGFQIQLDMSWKDSRLTLKNLKHDRDLNSLTVGQLEREIWVPTVVFNNTEGKHQTQLDSKVFAVIERQGSYVESHLSDLDNIYLFKGSENPIILTRIYDLSFMCDFDMAYYPFDTQTCYIILSMMGNSGKFVEIVGKSVKYTGPKDLNQFYSKSVSLMNGTTAAHSQRQFVQVSIVFSRRLFATMLTTYLPTILLCIVCFGTSHYNPCYFEAAVTVNLTSLLVLTTLFIGVFNTLPPTAYLKMVDIWLVANLFVPFCQVNLITMAERYRLCDKETSPTRSGQVGINLPHLRIKEANDQKILLLKRRAVTLASSVGLPAAYVTFAAVYFIIGASLRKEELSTASSTY